MKIFTTDCYGVSVRVLLDDSNTEWVNCAELGDVLEIEEAMRDNSTRH